ncbi:MAG TPA: hypothetical protein VFS43_16810 [Polyangiaceae bacterium]|nr:hypothetical protein [Polyangiaceae bacterium]
MRLTRLCRSILFSLVVVALALVGCGSSKTEAEEIFDSREAIVEQNGATRLALAVDRGGKAKLSVKGADGKPVEGVTGTLTVKGEGPKAPATRVPLAPDPKTKVLTAALPELTDDLTEVRYDLSVNGRPLNGTMHVPAGGTKELEENAKTAAKAKIAPGTRGPNGGVVQVVGDDVIEVVAGQKSGTVRAYVLDSNLKPVKVGSRTIKLGLVSEKGSETVVLGPDPSGQFLFGKLTLIANPIKITIAVTYHGETVVAVCNHPPGSVIVVGPGAPVIVILANVVWDVDVVVVQKPPVIVVHGKGKGKGKKKWKWKYK